MMQRRCAARPYLWARKRKNEEAREFAVKFAYKRLQRFPRVLKLRENTTGDELDTTLKRIYVSLSMIFFWFVKVILILITYYK
jgi:hypothetical protein